VETWAVALWRLFAYPLAACFCAATDASNYRF